MAGLQLGRRAGGGDPAVVEQDDVVGEPVGLLQVLGGEDQRGAAADQLAQQVPELVAAFRVEAGGRLVEEEDRRRGDQAGGEVEPAAHAAAVVADQPVAGVLELQLREQLGGAGAGDLARQVVEAADHLQVGGAAHQAVDGRRLAGQADPFADLGRLG